MGVKTVSDNIEQLIYSQIKVKDAIHEKIEKSHKDTDQLIIDTSIEIKDHVTHVVEQNTKKLEESFKNIIKQESFFNSV